MLTEKKRLPVILCRIFSSMLKYPAGMNMKEIFTRQAQDSHVHVCSLGLFFSNICKNVTTEHLISLINVCIWGVKLNAESEKQGHSRK